MSDMIGGTRIFVSDAATTLPKGKPQTDDMRHMVEHFEQLGLIRRIPGAFKIGDAMYVHPVIAAELRKRVVNRFERSWI